MPGEVLPGRVAANGLNGGPTLYTTYSRAIEYIPTTRLALVYMILFMATFTALTGCGLGIGLVTLMISIARARLPNKGRRAPRPNVAHRTDARFRKPYLEHGKPGLQGDHPMTLRSEPPRERATCR